MRLLSIILLIGQDSAFLSAFNIIITQVLETAQQWIKNGNEITSRNTIINAVELKIIKPDYMSAVYLW